MSELQIHNPSGKVNDDLKKAEALLRNKSAANTRRAYLSDWRHFEAWCEDRGLQAMPATRDTVALYVSSMSGEYKPTTISRRLVAISRAHKEQRYDSPAIRSQDPLHSIWTGLMRTYGAKKNKKTPILIEDIRLIIEGLSEDELRDRRDKAILLLGWAGGLRRSEIAGLDVSDITFGSDGMKIVIRRAKRDQEGKGLTKGIVRGDNPATCPVNAVRFWLKESFIQSGPVFRKIDRHGNINDSPLTGRGIAIIIKKLCRSIGLDDDLYSGHSLRSGFATQAAKAGAPERVIMRHTGHKSEASVREYIHEGSLFEGNPTSLLGL